MDYENEKALFGNLKSINGQLIKLHARTYAFGRIFSELEDKVSPEAFEIMSKFEDYYKEELRHQLIKLEDTNPDLAAEHSAELDKPDGAAD